jgi:membrane protease YdiL (CAAX protease family)
MGPLALLYLLVFLFWVPSLALRSGRALKHAEARAGARALPSKTGILLQTTIMLVLFALVSVFVARKLEIPLFPHFEWRPSAAGACLVVLLVMLATIPLRWRMTPDDVKRRVMLTRPQSTGDLGPWVMVSLAAGVSEEITYRGVLFSILWFVSGSAWIAAGVSAVAFAVAHATQGWRAALVILAFALAAQGVVWLAGSLYYAMLLHFLYDVLAGLVYLRLGRDVVPSTTTPGAAPVAGPPI